VRPTSAIAPLVPAGSLPVNRSVLAPAGIGTSKSAKVVCASANGAVSLPAEAAPARHVWIAVREPGAGACHSATVAAKWSNSSEKPAPPHP
jgi:hypothetical protein